MKDPENFYKFYFKEAGTFDFAGQSVLNDFLTKVQDDLGERDFTKLRDLFEEGYAGRMMSLQMGKIETFQFL